ncbi:MAG TPA: Hsp20/alpha crystallin family protein [Candidatus Limnocylindrales bacterium]|jgi:HSP20 family protein|nr:Hsp20/alpha crystallin family protein [Candidatus Limnocylindrales bacterium]
MDIIDLDNLKYFEDLQNQMEKMIKDIRAMGSVNVSCDRVWKPLVDIYETVDNIVVLVDIAGIKKEDIQIVFNKDLLIISGKRINPTQFVARQKMHQVEIDFGYFERVIKLTIPIQDDKIVASYKDGFLWIHLPKQNVPVSRKVEILAE